MRSLRAKSGRLTLTPNWPCETSSRAKITCSAMSAAASVASERYRPLSRGTGRPRTRPMRAGSPSMKSTNTAPATAATIPPRIIPSSTGMPSSSDAFASANPPAAAKVACISEIWPPRPVKIVIDRKMTARTNAPVSRDTHAGLTSVSITTTNPIMKTGNAIRESFCSAASLYSCAIAGGGGSTPASGSVTSRRSRSLGQKTSSRNSTRNGNDGRRSARELARRAEDVGERALTDPDEQAADQGHRDAREPSDRGSSDGRDDEQRVDVRVEREVERREQHTGEPGEQARQHPGDHAHALRVDARELDHPRALDHSTHLQAQRRVAEEQPEEEHCEQRDDDRDHPIGRDVVVAEVEDAERGIEPEVLPERPAASVLLHAEHHRDARRGIAVLVAEERPDDLGHRQEEAERRDELHLPRRGPHVAEQTTVEDQPDQRTDDEHRHDEPQPQRVLVARDHLVEDRAGCERLRAEREVEDPRRLVREDETRRDQRVHAADRHAEDQPLDDIVHLCDLRH